ncbi:MAG: hypothetical protein AB2A00_31815 [Myxococcota bacterium]
MAFDPSTEMPVFGSAWEAARNYGVDTTLLAEHAAMTPLERVQQLIEANRIEWVVQARASTEPPVADANAAALRAQGS